MQREGMYLTLESRQRVSDRGRREGDGAAGLIYAALYVSAACSKTRAYDAAKRGDVLNVSTWLPRRNAFVVGLCGKLDAPFAWTTVSDARTFLPFRSSKTTLPVGLTPTHSGGS